MIMISYFYTIIDYWTTIAYIYIKYSQLFDDCDSAPGTHPIFFLSSSI